MFAFSGRSLSEIDWFRFLSVTLQLLKCPVSLMEPCCVRDFSGSRSQGTKVIYITLSGSCQIRPLVFFSGPADSLSRIPASPPGLLGRCFVPGQRSLNLSQLFDRVKFRRSLLSSRPGHSCEWVSQPPDRCATRWLQASGIRRNGRQIYHSHITVVKSRVVTC